MTALDFPTSPSNGDTYENYVYDSTDGVWKRIAAGIELNGISDVTLSSPTTDQLLRWNGTEWVNGTANTDSIADDAITAAKLADTAGAVMVFADDTARGSAIPSPSEGMVTYLEDSDQVQVFDGSGYKPVGGLVAVKSALFTGIQDASVTAGNNVAVTDLSITHEVANASNKLIISAFFGLASSSINTCQVGIAVHDGTSLIGIATSVGDRTAVAAGGKTSDAASSLLISMPSMTFVHTPGSGSKTYTVRAINIDTSTRTLYVNRDGNDSDDGTRPRGVSSLVIQEVAV